MPLAMNGRSVTPNIWTYAGVEIEIDSESSLTEIEPQDKELDEIPLPTFQDPEAEDDDEE